MIHKSTKLSWIPIQDYFIRKQANKPFRWWSRRYVKEGWNESK
jgi:hypothetical protein